MNGDDSGIGNFGVKNALRVAYLSCRDKKNSNVSAVKKKKKALLPDYVNLYDSAAPNFSNWWISRRLPGL